MRHLASRPPNPPGRSTTAITAPGHQRWANPPKAGWHVVEWACELGGTFALVLGGLSAVVLDFGRHSPVAPLVPSTSARLLLTGLMFSGCGSLVAISPIGRRSGAHLNPAVTVAFWLRGHVHPHDLAGYVGAQCVGAIAAAGVLRWAWGARAASVHYGVTSPRHGLPPAQAAAIEALMTSVLLVTIFAFVSSARTAQWTPVAVWLVVGVLVWRGAPLTGTSLNPARSLGPAVVAGRWTGYWVYVAGPLGAALAVAGAWALSPWATLTAKLFHDPAYKSTLASQLPVQAGPVAL
jgi:aquaporin Z